MTIVWAVLYYVLLAYMILLWGRVILSLIQAFSPQWRPSGFMLVVCELVYSATDPPIKALGRVIPPVRLGQVQLDVAFIIVFLAVSILMRVFAGLAASA